MDGGTRAQAACGACIGSEGPRRGVRKSRIETHLALIARADTIEFDIGRPGAFLKPGKRIQLWISRWTGARDRTAR